MPIRSLGSQFAAIKGAFDAVPQEHWPEWTALNRFCDRLALSAFNPIQRAFKRQLNSPHPQKGLARFHIRVNDRRFNEEEACGKQPCSCQWKVEQLPLDEQMLGLLCFRPKTIPVPIPRELKRDLFDLIQQRTAAKVERIMHALVTNSPERLQVETHPLYPVAAKETIALMLVSLCGAIPGLIAAAVVVGTDHGPKERRQGPDGFSLKWKLAPGPGHSPSPLHSSSDLDQLCRETVEIAMEPIKKRIAHTSDFFVRIHEGQYRVRFKDMPAIKEWLKQNGKTPDEKARMKTKLKETIAPHLRQLREEYGEENIDLMGQLKPSTLELHVKWRHHLPPASSAP